MSIATVIQDYCETDTENRDHPPVGRVLFVGPQKRAPMAAALSECGFAVDRCPTATEALHRLQQEKITMVVTGGGGGGRAARTVLRRLRESTHHAHVPVVWLGAQGDDEDALLRQGVSLFLRAPFPVQHLVATAMFAI
ncbi:MAG: hypothetical protein P1V51_08895 [Deltaproteobacteria bacterium]|nr:hypothetical protein [Deltaproteobacteria bacterium]